MKKFVVILLAMFSMTAFAEETIYTNVGSVAVVTDFSRNVWMELEPSLDICGESLFKTKPTLDSDVAFFRNHTMLAQSNATNIIAAVTVDCETKEIKSVILQ